VSLLFARMLLLVCSATGLGLGIVGMRVPLAHMSLPEVRSIGRTPRSAVIGGQSLDSLVRLVSAHAPFRASRKLAIVRFDPQTGRQTAGNQPAAAKPMLMLSGIVWGTEPMAVLQGLPGIEGSKVVRRGDVIAGIRVSRIDHKRVWLSGLDTTWLLGLREPWK
jgi:hypothetical protein